MGSCAPVSHSSGPSLSWNRSRSIVANFFSVELPQGAELECMCSVTPSLRRKRTDVPSAFLLLLSDESVVKDKGDVVDDDETESVNDTFGAILSKTCL